MLSYHTGKAGHCEQLEVASKNLLFTEHKHIVLVNLCATIPQRDTALNYAVERGISMVIIVTFMSVLLDTR